MMRAHHGIFVNAKRAAGRGHLGDGGEDPAQRLDTLSIA
jgi:hypothetical protein